MGVSVFKLPDLGEGLAEAEVVEWHVSEGDRIVADQPLVSVETDKAVVEVPSPWSGVVMTLRAQPGDILQVGDALAEIDDGARSDTGAIVGTLHGTSSDAVAERSPPEPGKTSEALRAVPAARALAAASGVDLAQVTGTGPGGAITRADVEAAAARLGRNGVSGARRSMARAMARAHAEVVPATVTDLADITAWHGPDADVTVRLVRAIRAAVSAEPALNRWYDPGGGFGDPPGGIALGFAVDTPQGLYVPVLEGVDAMAPDQVRAELDRAAARVREQRPDNDAPRRPTITLSNFGMIGGRHAALVVVPPQVAIVGAGRAREIVAWAEGGPVRAVELPLSLTFDHRAVTGGEAARFLAAIVADLETMEPDAETS